MGHTIIRGETTDEKFASADKALVQLERRIRARSIIAPLTPIVVMGYCKEDDDGVIVRAMFPITGFVTKLSILIERLEDAEFLKKDILKFHIESFQSDGTKITREISTKKLSAEMFSNFKIVAGSTVVVLVNTKAFGIWYGLVIEPETPIKREVEFSSVEDLASVEREMIEE